MRDLGAPINCEGAEVSSCGKVPDPLPPPDIDLMPLVSSRSIGDCAIARPQSALCKTHSPAVSPRSTRRSPRSTRVTRRALSQCPEMFGFSSQTGAAGPRAAHRPHQDARKRPSAGRGVVSGGGHRAPCPDMSDTEMSRIGHGRRQDRTQTGQGRPLQRRSEARRDRSKLRRIRPLVPGADATRCFPVFEPVALDRHPSRGRIVPHFASGCSGRHTGGDPVSCSRGTRSSPKSSALPLVDIRKCQRICVAKRATNRQRPDTECRPSVGPLSAFARMEPAS